MAPRDLGQQLYRAGWQQGVLLPALGHSFIFDPDNPLTSAAKRAAKVPDAIIRAAAAPFSVVLAPLRQHDFLAVASQTCDIVKSPDVEPTVLAMRAFVGTNPQTLRAAATNSTSLFLLDPDRNLIVDATVVAAIEKPALLILPLQPGAPNEDLRRRFASWIARRFERAEHSDEIVEAVVAPILNNLRALEATNDSDLAALDEVQQVRFLRLHGMPPYQLRLLFIVAATGLSDGGVALARLVARMRTWFAVGKATLVSWDALSLYQISAGDFADTDRLYLDHYTYRGNTIRGIAPVASW